MLGTWWGWRALRGPGPRLDAGLSQLAVRGLLLQKQLWRQGGLRKPRLHSGSQKRQQSATSVQRRGPRGYWAVTPQPHWRCYYEGLAAERSSRLVCIKTS